MLNKQFGACRFIYNLALETKSYAWQTQNKKITAYDLHKQLTELRSDYKWLQEVNRDALEKSIMNLDTAYKSFFRGRGFPKFKSKKGHQSFRTSQDIKVFWENNSISIPKIKNIPIVLSRKFEGEIRQAAVSKTLTGKYFVSILVKTTDVEKQPKSPSIKNSVGIDLGIKTFATLSSGEQIENPKHLRKSLKRLKHLQRTLSRKTKGSNNRNKARIALAKQHEKVANQRHDFLHKVTHRLVSENQTVCLETLNTKGMMQNHKLAQALSDISIGKFNELIEYKAKWNGVNILRCGQFEASSKTCNNCGEKNQILKLSDRKWVCACGSVNDRDLNAAKNIRDFCFNNLKQLPRALRKVKRVEKSSSDSVKHEAIIL